MSLALRSLLFLCALLCAPLARAETPPGYRYCSLYQAEGATIYYSAVFPQDPNQRGVGAENGFNAYVSAQHKPGAHGAHCFGPYPSAAEAEQEANRSIGLERIAGRSIVMTYWRYSGG
jgi:hypothetical protein